MIWPLNCGSGSSGLSVPALATVTVTDRLTFPDALLAVRLYVVVVVGLTDILEPITTPMPLSIVIVVAFCADQVSTAVCPEETVAGVAEKLLMTGAGTRTDTDAVAFLVPSAAEVAVTSYFPGTLGAEYKPLALIVPAVTLHETAVLLVPDTTAVNCCVPLGATVDVVGETEIVIGFGFAPPLPQPVAVSNIEQRTKIKNRYSEMRTSINISPCDDDVPKLSVAS